MSFLQDRKEAALAAFIEFERMQILFECLGQAPSFGDPDESDEATDIVRDLVTEGLLIQDNGTGYCTTTTAGREALLNYINDSNEGE